MQFQVDQKREYLAMVIGAMAGALNLVSEPFDQTVFVCHMSAWGRPHDEQEEYIKSELSKYVAGMKEPKDNAVDEFMSHTSYSLPWMEAVLAFLEKPYDEGKVMEHLRQVMTRAPGLAKAIKLS